MFDKDGNKIPYNREHYTLAESLYNSYLEMRWSANEFENIKYTGMPDNFKYSKEGKEGFMAGVYIMLSLFGDM